MFIVYHTASTMERARYKREGDAKRNAAKRGPEYSVASLDAYNRDVVHMVTRKNLMTGKEFQEPSNTPNYMSPASEAYWSM